jgi:hypothetical protein
MKKLAFLLVLLLTLGVATAFAEDEMAVAAEVDGWAKVVWGMDFNAPISTGFAGSAELTIELNFIKLSKAYPAKGSDEDGPVYGWIKFSKLTFAPEAAIYQTNRNTMTTDPDFLDTGNIDILSMDSFNAKIYAKPLYVQIYTQPELEYSLAATLDTAHGGGVEVTDGKGPMAAAYDYPSGGWYEPNDGAGSTSTADTGGITVGIDTDIFDVAFKAATPFNWNFNTANAYALAVNPVLDLDAGDIVPIKVQALAWMTLGYNTYRYFTGSDNPWDIMGIGSRVEVNMLKILGLTEMFNLFKPAVDFDVVFPLNGNPKGPWTAPRFEIGFDADFRLAWNVDADTQAEDGSRMRFEVSYSDPSKLGDLDMALTLVEDDDNGYIPRLEYYLLAKLTDMLGQGSDWNAPYASTLGLELDAFIDYKIYLDEDETMWIEPHAGAGYDFGVLQQPEDSVFKMNFYLLAGLFPNVELKLMYDTPQLLKSQEGYVITFDENYSPTATLTSMTAQDIGEITLEAKVLY